MSKVYARQIRPEYQESPLEWEGYPADIIMPGNRNYRSHNTDHAAYRQIMNYFDDMADTWYDDGIEAYEPTNIPRKYNVIHKPHELTVAEILHDYGFEPETADAWTQEQLDAWQKLMENRGYSAEDKQVFLVGLQLITGMEWDTHSIHGCCQGDYADIIFPVDAYSREDIERFETAYFNLGTEWVIHDEQEAPESPEDVNGYTVYCYGCDNEAVKKEIASLEGVQPEDVVLYCWTGEPVSYKYRTA